MFLKNTANQTIFFGLVNASTGAALIRAIVFGVYSIDNATSNPSGYKQGQTCGGTFTEMNNGQYRYVPLQSETNGADLAFTFFANMRRARHGLHRDRRGRFRDPHQSLHGHAANAAAIATAVLTDTTSGDLNVAGSPGKQVLAIPTNPYTGTPPTTVQIAAALLKTPANLLNTDSSGNVTANNSDFLSLSEQNNLSQAPAQAALAASEAATAAEAAQALPTAAQIVAAIITALESAGLLQTVPGTSSSSGQTEPAMQFTAQALAASATGSSVNITTQDVVIRSNS